MKKLLVLILIYLMQTSAFAAGKKPSILFSNVSTVQVGDPVDFIIPPDEVTWAVVTFGNISAWDLTLDASIDAPCDTATYYPVSTMTEETVVLSRGVDVTGQRCFRANLNSITGPGGISNVKIRQRGQ